MYYFDLLEKSLFYFYISEPSTITYSRTSDDYEFHEARAKCAETGEILAAPLTLPEWITIQNSYTSSHVWLGIYDYDGDNVYEYFEDGKL